MIQRLSSQKCGQAYYARNREACQERSREYAHTHRDAINATQRKYRRALAERGEVCEILQNHADDLADDPERLSTEFLQRLIGSEC